MSTLANSVIYVVIDDGINQYYLLKVVRRGFDVYCIPPQLGIHFSVHESGVSHFTHEETDRNGDEIAVALMAGEAGVIQGRNIIRAPLTAEGRASSICLAFYPVDTLADDFPLFKRSLRNAFVIDAQSLPANTGLITVGVWGVPDNNRDMFWWNNPAVQEVMVYKSSGEPPIWIYVEPH